MFPCSYHETIDVRWIAPCTTTAIAMARTTIEEALTGDKNIWTSTLLGYLDSIIDSHHSPVNIA